MLCIEEFPYPFGIRAYSCKALPTCHGCTYNELLYYIVKAILYYSTASVTQRNVLHVRWLYDLCPTTTTTITLPHMARQTSSTPTTQAHVSTTARNCLLFIQIGKVGTLDGEILEILFTS